MFGKFYVGHEVIVSKKYTKFNYASNSICCSYANNYFISRKCVLLRRDKNGNYFYLSNFNKCNIIDPNDMEVFTRILSCSQCDKGKKDSTDCQLNIDCQPELLGVLDIQPIQSFAKTTDLDLAISLINEYNSRIDDDENYVYVDDVSYIDTVRDIDDHIGRKRYKKNL